MSERGNVSQALNIILAILLLIALAFTAYSINQVRSLESEAKGKPPWAGSGKKTTATLTVSPSPVIANASFTITGAGFAKNSTVYVGLSGYCCLVSVTTDSSGSFSSPQPRLTMSGTYTAIAMVQKKKTWTIAASTPFEVVEQ